MSSRNTMEKTQKRNLRSQPKKDLENEKQRTEHQKELAEMKTEMALKEHERKENEKEKSQDETEKPTSYTKASLIPHTVSSMTIFVDRKNNTVVVPIYNTPFPCHVSTIRSVSKSDDGHSALLRINFANPQKAPDETEHTARQAIRSMTFKSKNQIRMTSLARDIADLKKRYTQAEEEKKESGSVVAQPALAMFQTRSVFLHDVHIRPVLQKKFPGDLEIHSNGVLFRQAVGDQNRVEILFTNIKHLFFVPCDTEPCVIIHFHLRTGILIGKKKTTDIQFYKETAKALSEDTTGARRKLYHRDEDEVLLEKHERIVGERLNAEFQAFAEKIVAAAGTVDLQTPETESAFLGITHRQTALLRPTEECLVYLTEPPFTVITLSDVEVVSLERVIFGLKNFDMVFVFFDKASPPVSIASIPMNSLEAVKDWLDGSNILFIEGKINYNWNNMLKMVRTDPVEFYSQGGWMSLQPHEGEEEESQESVFEESAEDGSDETEDSQESVFEEESVEEESAGAESEGMDWDELEEKTRREEEQRK
ncbi:MAG: FACT complex component Spt16-related protein [Amphiamblys sp. WSBS2006]|nr:MAG: FACT complex component Spt16-related protein [Amphiamblys sp. WSBS2006]